MRLTPQQIAAIKNCVNGFDPLAKIYLFGSRTDDRKKGGDIDLLIFSEKIQLEQLIKLKLKLYDALGEQKIDIVIPDDSNQAFVDVIKKEAILL